MLLRPGFVRAARESLDEIAAASIAPTTPIPAASLIDAMPDNMFRISADGVFLDIQENPASDLGPVEDFPFCVPVGSQAPHAAGVAYAFKLRKQPRVAVCMFGDGATSVIDAMARGDILQIVVFSLFVGVALTLFGERGSPLAAVLGLWVESVGVLALGLVTMAVGELAWWCGVALIVWGWALVCLLLLPMMGVLAPPFPVSWGGLLAGVSWLVVGYGVFRAARGQTEQPQRER